MSELPPERLQTIVEGVSDRFRSTEDHKLVRVRAGTDGSPEVSVRSITTSAPEDELLGTTAPASWLAVGARLADTACCWDLSAEDPATSAAARLGGEPGEGELTFLLDRSGNAAGVLRHDGSTRRLDTAPEGFLGDTFRRVLGLPTPPPPADTVELWLRIWLDRLSDTLAFPDRDRHSTWETATAVHPAPIHAGRDTTDHPAGLVVATRELADAWPWDRLRDTPDVLDDLHFMTPQSIADWMDDGMFARGTLAALPTTAVLVRHLRPLLPDVVMTKIRQTITCCGLAWPHAS